MKSLFSFIVLAFVLVISPIAQAAPVFSVLDDAKQAVNETKPTIGILIGGQGAIRSNEKAINAIYEKLKEKFPEAQYNLIHDEKLVHDILVFAEDEDVNDISQIKKAQLAKFGEEKKFDYVICLVLSMGHGRAGADFFTANYDIDVDMNAKVVDVATKQYIYRQNLMGHGRSSAGIGLPSSVNAFAKAVKACTEQFVKEISISPLKPEKTPADENTATVQPTVEKDTK